MKRFLLLFLIPFLSFSQICEFGLLENQSVLINPVITQISCNDGSLIAVVDLDGINTSCNYQVYFTWEGPDGFLYSAWDYQGGNSMTNNNTELNGNYCVSMELWESNDDCNGNQTLELLCQVEVCAQLECGIQICGYKYVDSDCNCEQDDDNGTLAGWVINLHEPTTCDVYQQTVTDIDGQYCFYIDADDFNYLGGACVISEELQEFVYDSSLDVNAQMIYDPCSFGPQGSCFEDAPIYSVLLGGTPTATYQSYDLIYGGIDIIDNYLNFYNCPQTCTFIDGYKFLDNDCNCENSPGDLPLENWPIIIEAGILEYMPSNWYATIAELTTDSDGYWSFCINMDDVLDATGGNNAEYFTITEGMEPGYVSCNGGDQFYGAKFNSSFLNNYSDPNVNNMPPYQALEKFNFYNCPDQTISISGCKYLDNDCNGVFSDGDEKLSDWVIYWDNGFETGSVITDSLGCYSIGVPIPSNFEGAVIISEESQLGYIPFDSDTYILSVDIDNPQSYLVDFFNCPELDNYLCGYKYIDVNCNCIYDSLDYTYEGWPMNLWWDDGSCPPTLIHTEITDENGQYCFNLDSLNLNPNYTYMLSEEIPGESTVYTNLPGYAPCEQGLTGFGCAFSGGAPIYQINEYTANSYQSNYITLDNPAGEGAQIINSNIEHNFFNCTPCDVNVGLTKYIHTDCNLPGSVAGGWDLSLVSFDGDTLSTGTTNEFEGGFFWSIPCDSLDIWTTNGPISIVENMQSNYIACSNYSEQFEIYYQPINTSPPLSGAVGTYDINGEFVPQNNYEFHNIELQESYNCYFATDILTGLTTSSCTNPGDGAGFYSTLNDCEENCVLATWNCNSMGCVDPGDGTGYYGDLNTCEDDCNGINIDEEFIHKSLIKVVDILGRQVDLNFQNRILLHIYDDGSVERRYILK
tara:strand:- start:1449 stop:4196 length:2748 start_codon:yes stop_codon:yes gene_type:complete